MVSKTVMFRHFSFKKEEKLVVAVSTAEVKHFSVRDEHQRSGFIMEGTRCGEGRRLFSF